MALIEIDGLPIKNGGSFHGYVSHNQMALDSETSQPEVKLRPSLQLMAQSASPLSGELSAWHPGMLIIDKFWQMS